MKRKGKMITRVHAFNDGIGVDEITRAEIARDIRVEDPQLEGNLRGGGN